MLARATEHVQLVNAAGALAPGTDDVTPTAELLFSEAIERHRQEEAEADALQARFVDAYQRGERRELLLDFGRAALAARETVNRTIVRLESDLTDGILDRASSMDVAETMEATQFASPSSPEKLLGDVRRAAESAKRKHVVFVSLVRRSNTISKATQSRVIGGAKDDLARRADANSLARTRAARTRKSVHYPKGSMEYAQVVPEGSSARALQGMTVFYLADEGAGDWRKGFVSAVGVSGGRGGERLKFTLSLERSGSSSRWVKDVSLPSPLVRFLPSRSEDATASDAPAPLPTEDGATTFGILEHGTKSGSAASTAVEVCLVALTPAEERMAQEAVREPPDGDAGVQVGDEVWFSTLSIEGEPVELSAKVIAIEAVEATIRRVDGLHDTERTTLTKLRPKGFLEQPLRRWSFAEVICREHARRLRTPPSGRVPMATLRAFWLSSNIMDAIGAMLSTKFPKVQTLSMGLGEFALHQNFRPNLPRTQRLCQKLAESRKDDLFGEHVEQWLLPFCRGDHIFGVSVHFGLRRIIVIDSGGGTQAEPTDVRRAAQLLVHEIHRLAGKGKFDWTGWKISSLERLSPQQGDDMVNCAVYTLACFWALACGVSLSAIRRQDLTRWRERFLVWLLDGGASLGLSS